jgi:hypothetical protein
MIDAYIVRDPQGRVIGMSVVSAKAALDDAWINGDVRSRLPYKKLVEIEVKTDKVAFLKKGNATVSGYTLTRKQVAL